MLLLDLLLYTDSDLTCSKIIQLFQGEFPASEAKELGTYLNIPYAITQEFRINNMGNAKGMLIDVLNYWLENDPEKSWSKLAEAVKNCGYGILADKIRQNSSQFDEGNAGEVSSEALLFMWYIDGVYYCLQVSMFKIPTLSFKMLTISTKSIHFKH